MGHAICKFSSLVIRFLDDSFYHKRKGMFFVDPSTMKKIGLKRKNMREVNWK